MDNEVTLTSFVGHSCCHSLRRIHFEVVKELVLVALACSTVLHDDHKIDHQNSRSFLRRTHSFAVQNHNLLKTRRSVAFVGNCNNYLLDSRSYY